MRVTHEGTVLATDVEVADTWFARARGLMFRRSFSAGKAMVFRFDRVSRRDVHMLFVPFPLDVLWLVDGSVERVERLRPWIGMAAAPADTLVELPAGAAAAVSTGDDISIAIGSDD